MELGSDTSYERVRRSEIKAAKKLASNFTLLNEDANDAATAEKQMRFMG